MFVCRSLINIWFEFTRVIPILFLPFSSLMGISNSFNGSWHKTSVSSSGDEILSTCSKPQKKLASVLSVKEGSRGKVVSVSSPYYIWMLSLCVWMFPWLTVTFPLSSSPSCNCPQIFYVCICVCYGHNKWEGEERWQELVQRKTKGKKRRGNKYFDFLPLLFFFLTRSSLSSW